jgi:hypothetical protein
MGQHIGNSPKPLRLGEIFVQKKIINPRQLEEALKCQLIYGGHLGTCLLELGYVDEQTLGEVLAGAVGVKFASAAKFESIPPSVIRSVPCKTVEKHHAVPFKLVQNVLHVAMIDPRNLQAIDELSFASGKRIEPWIAPEARIFQAMERYYEIPRRQRYITICRELDSHMENRPRRRARSGAAPQPSPVYGDSAHRKRSTPAEPAHAGSANEPDESTGWIGSEALVPPTDPPEIDPPPAAEPAISQAATAEMLEAEFSSRLCNAETMEDLAGPALQYAGQGMARCALFAVNSATARLWGAKGLKLDEDRMKNLALAVPSDPIFDVLLGSDYYRGPVPKSSGLHKFYASLDLGIPSDTLVLPGYMDDRLLVLMFGDGGVDGRIQGETERYRRIVRKLALALKLVVLKKAIRST